MMGGPTVDNSPTTAAKSDDDIAADAVKLGSSFRLWRKLSKALKPLATFESSPSKDAPEVDGNDEDGVSKGKRNSEPKFVIKRTFLELVMPETDGDEDPVANGPDEGELELAER